MMSGDLSYDPDGSITSWEWFVDNISQGKREFLVYTFTDTDNHSIKLNIIDDDGLKSNIVKVVKANALDEINPRNPTSMTNTESTDDEINMDLNISNLVKYGPLVYKSFFDSPFKAKFVDNSDYFYLDDFESGGISVPGVSVNYGHVISPGEETDSVDNDGDGLNDGFGRAGFSYFSDKGNNSLTFTFDKNVFKNKKYPNYIGIVLTDTYDSNRPITLEAYDVNGQSIKKIEGKAIGNGIDGRTDDDQFYGLYADQEIKGFSIAMDHNSDYTWMEVDHLQFGYYNPPQ